MGARQHPSCLRAAKSVESAWHAAGRCIHTQSIRCWSCEVYVVCTGASTKHMEDVCDSPHRRRRGAVQGTPVPSVGDCRRTHSRPRRCTRQARINDRSSGSCNLFSGIRVEGHVSPDLIVAPCRDRKPICEEATSNVHDIATKGHAGRCLGRDMNLGLAGRPQSILEILAAPSLSPRDSLEWASPWHV